MDLFSPWLLLAGASTLLLLGVVFGRLGRRWRQRRAARRRASRARKGELRAERLLEELGYEVLERQPRRSLELRVNGEMKKIDLRPDLIVRRGGRRLVAEVKTGEWAPRIESKATRRQLLEYRVACTDASGVLLVDAEAGAVQEVQFPLEAAPRQYGVYFLVGFIGVAVGAAMSWILLRS